MELKKFVCVYICMYVCVFACMYACVHAYVYCVSTFMNYSHSYERCITKLGTGMTSVGHLDDSLLLIYFVWKRPGQNPVIELIMEWQGGNPVSELNMEWLGGNPVSELIMEWPGQNPDIELIMEWLGQNLVSELKGGPPLFPPELSVFFL